MTKLAKLGVLAIVGALAGMSLPAAVYADGPQLAHGKGGGNSGVSGNDKSGEMRGKAEKRMKDAKAKGEDNRQDDVDEKMEAGKAHSAKGRENAMERGEGEKKGLKRLMGQ